MIFGNFKTYNLTIETATNEEIDLEDVVSTEKKIKLVPSAAGLTVLFTNSNSVVVADSEDYTLPTGETEFEIGRGLDRISFYNGSGEEVKVSIAVLY